MTSTEEDSSDNGWPRWGEAVGHALKERNLTINAAAKRLGVRNTTLRRWVEGVGAPDLAKLPDIVELTGLSHTFQLYLGDVLPSSLHPDAHAAQVAEVLRSAVGTVRQLIDRASELAFADAGARLAGILLDQGSDLQITLRRAYRGSRYPVHLSTYVGVESFGSEVLEDVELLRKRVTQIVGESAGAFGARWREQDAHDWDPPRPRLILNVPQHERPRPPIEVPLSASPNILLLGCPYAHAEYVGALIAESLGYGYHDVRYSVPLPLDRSPTDGLVTSDRTSFTRRLARDESLTRRHVWSITDHRVIPQVAQELSDAEISFAIYVRSDDALLSRGGEVWNIDQEEMRTLRQTLDDVVAEGPWPAITIRMSDELLQPTGQREIDKDRVADLATQAAADAWRALAGHGCVPRGDLALGSLRTMFDDRGGLIDLRESLVKDYYRMPPRIK